MSNFQKLQTSNLCSFHVYLLLRLAPSPSPLLLRWSKREFEPAVANLKSYILDQLAIGQQSTLHFCMQARLHSEQEFLFLGDIGLAGASVVFGKL